MASMRQYAADFIKFWREKCDNRLLEDKLEVISFRTTFGKTFPNYIWTKSPNYIWKKVSEQHSEKMSVLMLEIST
jgi:hypothetical protein